MFPFSSFFFLLVMFSSQQGKGHHSLSCIFATWFVFRQLFSRSLSQCYLILSTYATVAFLLQMSALPSFLYSLSMYLSQYVHLSHLLLISILFELSPCSSFPLSLSLIFTRLREIATLHEHDSAGISCLQVKGKH